MPWSWMLVLLVGATPQAGEPHPFTPAEQSVYDALFDRLKHGDASVKPEAEAFLASHPTNPRSHFLAGVASLRARDKVGALTELSRALTMEIGPPERRASVLRFIASAYLEDQPRTARVYLDQALRIAPDDPQIRYLSAAIDLKLGNILEGRRTLEALVREDPQNGGWQADLAGVRWMAGDHPAAMEALKRAKALGATRPYFERFETESRRERWIRTGGLWFGGSLMAISLWLAAVAIAARLLSRASLQTPAAVDGRRTATGSWIERASDLVVWAAVVLLVVAMPVLLVSTMALGVGLVWGMLKLHTIVPVLILGAGLGVLGAIWGVLRAVFLRLGVLTGRVLRREDEPRLFALLDEVAAVASSDPVREVVLEPEAVVGVLERGSTLIVLLGRGRRVLQLGYAALQQLTVGELRSVLAHEYGHFSHGETRLLPLIRRTEVVSVLMLRGTARGGWVAYLNPAFWFLRAYVNVFLRLTRAQGRRRELLADRVSALAYGGETFGRALSKVGHAHQDFMRAVAVLGGLQAMGYPPEGLYRIQALKSRDLPAPLRRTLDSDEVPDEFDSHPPPAERIERVRDIQGKVPDDSTPAVELLREPGRTAIDLTAEMLRRVSFSFPQLPAAVRPAEEVANALSRLLDADELAARDPREALPFVESSVAEASQALGPEHPFLQSHLRKLADLRQANGDQAGADAAITQARRIAALGESPAS